ncbi:MAG: DUF4198 domain-containing protein [Synergistota bacterium]|nr:DUF4198 domain-containing protein [Synergistota bacterium]
MKRAATSVCLSLLLVFSALPAGAHFQMILPDKPLVLQGGSNEVSVLLKFTHPFEMQNMNMEKPAIFGVMSGGETEDLLGTLKQVDIGGDLMGWKTTYKAKRPGDLVFFVEPQPYWEPAEGCFIVHDTKVVVNAFGLEVGWDEPTGLRAEIIPLVRPYGLWAGNVFTGKVIVKGKPVADAEIEVEYYNSDRKVKAPADPFITQIVKADDNGIFTYAAPFAGWWGFAALTEAPEKMKSPEGEKAPVELGAVMWVYFNSAK